MLMEKTNYKVHGYTNQWSIEATAHGYGLLENNTYGDETCYLVVKLDQEPEMQPYRSTRGIVSLPTIMHVVCETFDDLETALEDEGII